MPAGKIVLVFLIAQRDRVNYYDRARLTPI